MKIFHANKKEDLFLKKRALTVIGHVEGGEAGVGVAEHGLNGVVSIDSAPTATSLPHPVQDSAYVQGIVPLPERHSLGLLGDSLAAPHRVQSRVAPSQGLRP